MDNCKYEYLLQEDFDALKDKDKDTIYLTNNTLVELMERITNLCTRHPTDKELKKAIKRAIKRYIVDKLDEERI